MEDKTDTYERIEVADFDSALRDIKSVFDMGNIQTVDFDATNKQLRIDYYKRDPEQDDLIAAIMLGVSGELPREKR